MEALSFSVSRILCNMFCFGTALVSKVGIYISRIYCIYDLKPNAHLCATHHHFLLGTHSDSLSFSLSHSHRTIRMPLVARPRTRVILEILDNCSRMRKRFDHVSSHAQGVLFVYRKRFVAESQFLSVMP